MSITKCIHSIGAIRKALYLSVWCILFISVAYSQAGQPKSDKLPYAADKANVSDAVSKLKQGNFDLAHVEIIANAGAVEAIPVLKEQFARTQDPDTKGKIASALARLGDKDDSYWDFLVQQATLAIENDAPPVVNTDAQGKPVPEQPSPQFKRWATAHHLAPPEAAEDMLYELPAKVAFLAETGDRRGISTLRRGLLSPNFVIQTFAASGLVKMQDYDSIPLIIEACKKASAEEAEPIAESLVYFDDPRAQRAVDTYLPKDQAKAFREARANGKKP